MLQSTLGMVVSLFRSVIVVSLDRPVRLIRLAARRQEPDIEDLEGQPHLVAGNIYFLEPDVF